MTVVKPDRTVEVGAVEVGGVDGDDVAVRAGLAAGDLVGVDGAERLRDGARVEPRDPGRPAPVRGVVP